MRSLLSSRPSLRVNHAPQRARVGVALLSSDIRRPARLSAIEEKKVQQDNAQETSKEPALFSDEELQKLRQLQANRDQGKTQSGYIQGALEEAQLITWPKPQKAFLDTLLVLAIVAGTGVVLLSTNILLADLSNWWYHIPKPDWL